MGGGGYTSVIGAPADETLKSDCEATCDAIRARAGVQCAEDLNGAMGWRPTRRKPVCRAREGPLQRHWTATRMDHLPHPKAK